MKIELTDAERERIERALYAEVNGLHDPGMSDNETPIAAVEAILASRLRAAKP